MQATESKMKAVRVVLLAAALLALSNCARRGFDEGDAVLVETIRQLERLAERVRAVPSRKLGDQLRDDVSDNLSSLASLTRQWNDLALSDDELCILMSIRGKALVQAAFLAAISPNLKHSLEAKTFLHRDLSRVWVFDLHQIERYARFLFTRDIPRWKVQSMFLYNVGSIERGSVAKYFTDRQWESLGKGWIVSPTVWLVFSSHGPVESVNGVPVEASHDAQLRKLIGPGGRLRDVSGMKDRFDKYLAEQSKPSSVGGR